MVLESLHPLMANPTAIDLPSGKRVHVKTFAPRFTPWMGAPLPDTYRKGYLLDFDGEPLYAELFIVRLLEREGWDAVWVDNYRGRFRREQPQPGMANATMIPEAQREALRRVPGGEVFRTGTWDIFAWRGDEMAFAEAKRTAKDSIKAGQKAWLEGALRAGAPLTQFFIVEWDVDGTKKESRRSVR